MNFPLIRDSPSNTIILTWKVGNPNMNYSSWVTFLLHLQIRNIFLKRCVLILSHYNANLFHKRVTLEWSNSKETVLFVAFYVVMPSLK